MSISEAFYFGSLLLVPVVPAGPGKPLVPAGPVGPAGPVCSIWLGRARIVSVTV